MSTSNKINYFQFVSRSAVNGPGERAVLWVQGCHFHCRGCFNRQSWDFVVKELASPREMFERIEEIYHREDSYEEVTHETKKIEGVTFSGGEPMLQAEGLSELAELLQSRGLSVMVYTGYEMDELKRMGDSAVDTLLSNADIVVAGRYNRNIPPEELWVGSGNQTVHILSDRYTGMDVSLSDAEGNSDFEVEIDGGGTFSITGFFPEYLAGGSGER